MAHRVNSREMNEGITQAMIDAVYDRVAASGYADGPFEPFIVYLAQKKNMGGGEWKAVAVTPYMMVDGRVREMIAANAGRRYELVTYINTGETTLPVEMDLPNGNTRHLFVPPFHAMAVYVSPDGGITAGTSKIGNGRGADQTNPLENAETSAIGRALAFAGFGLLPGSGIASAEEVQAARDEAARLEEEEKQHRGGQGGNGRTQGNGNGRAASAQGNGRTQGNGNGQTTPPAAHSNPPATPPAPDAPATPAPADDKHKAALEAASALVGELYNDQNRAKLITFLTKNYSKSKVEELTTEQLEDLSRRMVAAKQRAASAN